MHIKLQLGGKYTHAVIDIPVPIAGWLWNKLHRKYFAEAERAARIEEQNANAMNAELRKIKEYRETFAEAVKLQTEITEATKDAGEAFLNDLRSEYRPTVVAENVESTNGQAKKKVRRK